MTAHPLPPIHHQPAEHRFTAVVDGLTSEACYRMVPQATGAVAGTTMVMTHTEVPAAQAGRGIAAALVQAALAHARSQGHRVRPQCSYVHVYMQRHPETLDLLEPPGA